MDSVHVVILNFNGGHQTCRCLASLKLNGAGNVLILDNHSTDDSVKIILEHAGLGSLVQSDANRGYAGGMNLGVEKANDSVSRADAYLLVTQDTVLDEAAFNSMIRTMTANPGVAIVGPVIYSDLQRKTIFSAGGLLLKNRCAVRHLVKPASVSPYEVDWVDGCCLLIRRDVFIETGGFDERYFMYYEENNLCQRVRRKGWRIVVCPEAAVYQEKDPGTRMHSCYYLARNRLLFWRENYGVPSYLIAILAILELVVTTWRVMYGRVSDMNRDRGERLRLGILWKGTILGLYDALRKSYGYRNFKVAKTMGVRQ